MAYVCLKCKKEFELEGKSVKCPYCGYRIVVKTRPEFRKKVNAK